MRRPVRALHRILMYTILLLPGTEASDDSQIIIMDLDSKETMPSTRNKDIHLPIEHLDNPLDNSANFIPTQTEEIEHYSRSSSSSTELYDYDADQFMKYTKQTDPLPYSQSTDSNSDIEHLLDHYPQNELAQKCTESNSPSNCHQPTGTKRPKQAKKKNTPRRKLKKAEESTSSSLDSDSTDNNKLTSSRIHKTKKYISAWNNARLKNRHRESLHESYKPAVAFNKFGSIYKYREIGNEMHQSLIKTHVKYCKTVYSKMPVQNEFWFTIASRSTCMHTKHADCRAINENPSNYKFIEELNDYYAGLPGDIVRYMDKHGPIVSKQKSIKKNWKESIGDIYVRKTAESEYGIGKETITFESSNEYRPVATAVRMILGLPEVHKDLSNLTVKFIKKTLEGISLKTSVVVKELYEIVKKRKSLNRPKIDDQHTILCNLFTDILHQTCVSNESIIVQLYTEMYKSLTYFYKKAEVCEEILESKRKKKNREKEYYLLAGKCIIKLQRYIKFVTTIDLKESVSEYKHKLKDEINKWTISSDIHSHYHIHYVDNTKQKYTRVCMPMCLDESIHTISQTVEYLKKIHSIEKEEWICPYKRDSSGDWMYIQDGERNKTVNEFTNCDIVFYYIEEGMKENYFTFAEFESCIQPKGEKVRIPLFLSPLMRSAVSMGPFEEKNKTKHKLVNSMQSMCLQPSVYTYKEKYKTTEHSHVYYYYSNLYIRRDSADLPTIDCYIMDSKAIIDNDTATVEWYVKIPSSVDEYTHCLLSDKLISDQDKYDKFRKAVTSQEYTPDSAFYGFCLQSSLEKTGVLVGAGCSTNYSIDPNSIAKCKLCIVSIHKISIDPKISDIQSKIDGLDKKVKQINMKIKEKNTTEKQKKELKRKRNIIGVIKCKKNQKLQQMQLLTKEETSVITFPSCAFFMVFRHSNTQIKSNLGTHNEILDALAYRYT